LFTYLEESIHDLAHASLPAATFSTDHSRRLHLLYSLASIIHSAVTDVLVVEHRSTYDQVHAEVINRVTAIVGHRKSGRWPEMRAALRWLASMR